MVLAPYIQKATALIGHQRRVGGNQFRHVMATLTILLDYKYTDPVLLKASVIHDLPEDVPETNLAEIERLDEDGTSVVQLVLEVTRREEPKRDYLARIRDTGSKQAKILKVADRISNLTDLHLDIFERQAVAKLLDETEEFILPMAIEVDANMAIELSDLMGRRRHLLEAVPTAN